MNQIIKYFSAIFFISYILVAFVWPTLRTYKKTGVNPVTFGTEDTAHNFIGRWFKVLIALMPVVIIAYWVGLPIYSYLLPAYYLEASPIQWTGIVFCVASVLWTVVAQWQMGNSWRIGIDEQHKTELIRHGLFRMSRNPIFIGMFISLLGFFMILPNAVTFTIAAAGYLLIHIQIRLEEEFLKSVHGDLYLQYCNSVRRLI